jgi:hypothetical protein
MEAAGKVEEQLLPGGVVAGLQSPNPLPELCGADLVAHGAAREASRTIVACWIRRQH